MSSLKPDSLHSITYLNATQFLGGMNDNTFKLLIIYMLIDTHGVNRSPFILSLAGAIFVIPFLLFSTPAGVLADRISKWRIIVGTKVIELVIVLLALSAFTWRSTVWGYSTLFLLATQSAIFGPSKYGIIPELVSAPLIPKANGWVTSFTYLAIIIGTFLASFLVDVTGRNYLLSASACVVLAVAGLITSLKIPFTPAIAQPENTPHHPFFKDLARTFQSASKQESLLMAMFGSAFFLFVGGFTQLNIIPFAMQSLHLSDVQGGYLFLMTALGIGAGCVIAGKLCRYPNELALSAMGALGMTLSFVLLDTYSNSLAMARVFSATLGLCGGLFLVPLDAYIQSISLPHLRGKSISIANSLSFLGVLLAAGAVYFFNETLGLPASKGFMIMGGLTLIVTIIIALMTARHLWQFWLRLLCKSCFNVMPIEGAPTDTIWVIKSCSSWVNIALLMTAQMSPFCILKSPTDALPRYFPKLSRWLGLVTPSQISDALKAEKIVYANQKTLDVLLNSIEAPHSIIEVTIERPGLHLIIAALFSFKRLPVRIRS